MNLNRFAKSTVGRDIVGLIIGRYLGGGQYRQVFEHATDPTLVVKVEEGCKDFSNVYEYQVWKAVEGTEYEKWFAPVVHIANCGTVLVQKRTEPVTVRDLPKKVPAWMTDLKTENWGMLNGVVVCHDYANHVFIERGVRQKAMRKARWD